MALSSRQQLGMLLATSILAGGCASIQPPDPSHVRDDIRVPPIAPLQHGAKPEQFQQQPPSDVTLPPQRHQQPQGQTFAVRGSNYPVGSHVQVAADASKDMIVEIMTVNTLQGGTQTISKKAADTENPRDRNFYGESYRNNFGQGGRDYSAQERHQMSPVQLAERQRLMRLYNALTAQTSGLGENVVCVKPAAAPDLTCKIVSGRQF